MPTPTVQDVHVDSILTNIAIAYRQNDLFIADAVFPTIPTDKKTDKYFVYDKGDWFRDEAQKRAPATESAGSGFRVGTDSFSCDVQAFHKDLDDQTVANTDAPLSAERDAVEFVTSRMQLRKEVQWASDYFVTGKWGKEYTGVSATPSAGTEFLQWNDANADPFANMEEMKEYMLSTTGYMGNTLVIGYTCFKHLKQHPAIYNRIKYTTADNITLDLLARMFEVEKVLVARAIVNTANRTGGAANTQTNTFSFVHGKSALFCYVNPRPSLFQPTAGYRFEWTGVSDGLGTTVGVSRIPAPLIRSTRIESQMAWDNKIVAADMGIFVNSVVA